MFKKLKIATALIFCLALTLTAANSVKITAEADGVAEIAMELDSGDVLHSKGADVKLPMASTTKIMTGLIIAEDCNLDEVVTVPDQAVGVEGSSIYLKHDEQISVRDLLYGLMLRSGNDAACALAICHSGSIEKFVEEMNARAQKLGANDTHFANPNGLPAEEHYTTARDLCNIARAAMHNQVFAEVVGTKNYHGDFRTFANKNKLLYKLEGANGVKTGFTEKAGRCLVSSAERNGMDVICVVLNCYDMYERSGEILNNCFDKYCRETLSDKKVYICNGKPCRLDKEYVITVEKDGELEYRVTTEVEGGDPSAVGKLEIYIKNNLIFSHNLYTIN